VKHLSGPPLKGRLLSLPKNIRIGQKGLLRTYTLTHYERSKITNVKSFKKLTTGANVIKLFNYIS
jgi:hypothetical protein